MAGTLFAARQGFISPESFTFTESAFVLAVVVLGGMGSQTSVILAAVIPVVSGNDARSECLQHAVARGADGADDGLAAAGITAGIAPAPESQHNGCGKTGGAQ